VNPGAGPPPLTHDVRQDMDQEVGMLNIVAVISGAIGAFTGILALIISYRTVQLEKCELSMSTSAILTTPGKAHLHDLSIRVEVVNRGRRISRIEEVGYEIPKDAVKRMNLRVTIKDSEIPLDPAGPSRGLLFDREVEGKTLDLQEGDKHSFALTSIQEVWPLLVSPELRVFAKDTLGHTCWSLIRPGDMRDDWIEGLLQKPNKSTGGDVQ